MGRNIVWACLGAWYVSGTPVVRAASRVQWEESGSQARGWFSGPPPASRGKYESGRRALHRRRREGEWKAVLMCGGIYACGGSIQPELRPQRMPYTHVLTGSGADSTAVSAVVLVEGRREGGFGLWRNLRPLAEVAEVECLSLKGGGRQSLSRVVSQQESRRRMSSTGGYIVQLLLPWFLSNMDVSEQSDIPGCKYTTREPDRANLVYLLAAGSMLWKEPSLVTEAEAEVAEVSGMVII
ncbi:hypothetical protein FB45DRAFT_871133 [Roridomyces roridus]|uniref:Uncharacterized protein n=1 Tax=Roridomyces roridus TaxID=1738132 RepID=A0AAD7BG66_9AGAR|nr:hypothetical protein FB45DRAFT_871133 [Roridomyces roridus]